MFLLQEQKLQSKLVLFTTSNNLYISLMKMIKCFYIKILCIQTYLILFYWFERQSTIEKENRQERETFYPLMIHTHNVLHISSGARSGQSQKPVCQVGGRDEHQCALCLPGSSWRGVGPGGWGRTLHHEIQPYQAEFNPLLHNAHPLIYNFFFKVECLPAMHQIFDF